MKKILLLLFSSVLFFSTSSFAAKNFLLDYTGEWVLNKQTNCEDPIQRLIIKKNRIEAGKLIGKINIKKDSLKLGKDLTGILSSYFSIQLSSEKSECKYEFIKEHPVHEFAKSPLRDLKVPDNWQLFKDPEELYKFHDFFKDPVHEKNPIRWWNMNSYVDDCERATSEFDTDVIEVEEDMGLARYYIRCKTVFTYKHFRDRDKGIKVFERILLSWAKTKPVIYRGFSSKQKSPKDHNGSYSDQGYASSMLIGDFASFYAVYYNDFNFTLEQRQSVDDYLSNWLINHDLEPAPGKKRCPLEKPKRWERKGYEFHGDHCGSNRWRIGLGAIYLGLRTANQKLFTAGNRHIEINLAATDKDGIYLDWARKGAMALSYQRQLPEVLTLLAVAYESIGYDFYEHQLPHGSKIHEVYEAFFDFIYHPEKLNKYADTRPKYAGTDLNSFNKLPLSEKWEREMIYPEVLTAQSKGYVLRYRPDLMDKIDYTKTWDMRAKEHVSVFVDISGLAIYEAANQNVAKGIAEKKAKKEVERIEAASELYIFKLEGEMFNIKLDKVDFIETESPNKKQKKNNASELHKAFIQGSLRLSSNKKIDFKTLVFKQDRTNEERLVIYVGDDRGEPEMDPFTQHRDSLQKKCGSELMNEWGWLSFISETTHIEQARKQQCHYDYFKEVNDTQAWELFQAVLGGTNSILNYLQTNTEELAKQKEEKNIQDTSKLYIFKIEGETFNLALDNVDFIETKSFELERNEKYLRPYQLHKGFIHGSLIKEKVNIYFSTLVFKQANPQEQRLVIHVDDRTVEPLKRHSDSLQKKCGSELMNEWGWLSFISETTDTEKASEQQCHYNYFKNSNDKEAFILFETVLGGTNSIVEYLENNVEQ